MGAAARTDDGALLEGVDVPAPCADKVRTRFHRIDGKNADGLPSARRHRATWPQATMMNL
jgi:hypothetical protein